MRIDLGQATAAAVQAEVNSDATRAIQARQRARVETTAAPRDCLIRRHRPNLNHNYSVYP